MVWVEWQQAVDYCRWAQPRLPTEVEWEYAARGGKQLDYATSTGEISSDLANRHGTTGADGWPFTAPVGSFPPNPFGLFDMSQNVWEWCQDRYRAYTPKGYARARSRFHVRRGGSYASVEGSTYGRSMKHRGNHDTGFRCVASATGDR